MDQNVPAPANLCQPLPTIASPCQRVSKCELPDLVSNTYEKPRFAEGESPIEEEERELRELSGAIGLIGDCGSKFCRDSIRDQCFEHIEWSVLLIADFANAENTSGPHNDVFDQEGHWPLLFKALAIP